MATEEFRRVGLTDVLQCYAQPGKTTFESFNKSQLAMLQAFLETGQETLITLEDDILFQGDEWEIKSNLRFVIKELPLNWDIFYLGANLLCMDWEKHPPVKYSSHLARIYHAWTTHAVAYRRSVVEHIVNTYHISKLYDAFLSENVLPYKNAFIMRPMIAWQRPGKSDLWNNESDYTDAFVKSNKLII